MAVVAHPTVGIAVTDVVTVSGELDANTAPLLAAAVRSLPAGDRHVDATQVSFAATAAIGVLVRMHLDCLDAGERFTIETSPTLRRLIHLTEVDTALHFV